MALPYISPSERSYILTGLAHPKQPTRSDGRALRQYRAIELSHGDAPQSYGSARIVLGGRGGTEAVAGIKLEVVDGDAEEESAGRSTWRASIEVDVTPQAYPHLNSSGLTALSSLYANLISDHLIPYLPPIPILPPYKYYQPQIYVTLISASSGSVAATIFHAVRCAFSVLRVPRTKSVGWEAVAIATTSSDLPAVDDLVGTGLSGTDAGLSGAVRAGKGGSKGKGPGGRLPRTGAPKGGKDDEWDLAHTGGGDDDEGELLPANVLSGLPVCVTLNLIPDSEAIYLDASAQEELASTSRLHLFYCGSPDTNSGDAASPLLVCGMRVEGGEGVDIARVRSLLKDGESIATELMGDLNAHAGL